MPSSIHLMNFIQLKHFINNSPSFLIFKTNTHLASNALQMKCWWIDYNLSGSTAILKLDTDQIPMKSSITRCKLFIQWHMPNEPSVISDVDNQDIISMYKVVCQNTLKQSHYYCSILLLYSFMLSFFNYCAVTWHFYNVDSTHKIEKIQERALRSIFKVSIRLMNV